MAQNRSKPGPLITAVTGSGSKKAVAALGPEHSARLPCFQADFIAARFGLDATRARLTAELAWGRA